MIKLSVATHNICHFGKDPVDHHELFPDHTYKNGYDADDVAEMKKRWKSVYGSFQADLVGLQEYCPQFDLTGMLTGSEIVFAPYGYTVQADEFTSPQGHKLAVASKHPVTPVWEKSFAPASERRADKFYIDLSDGSDGSVTKTQRIAVFDCHPHPRFAEVRQQEYAQLVEEFRREETFIAFGDYNARTAEEYEIFRRAGYPMANGGDAGSFLTTETGSTCDNIIVSPDIRITNVRVLDRDFTLSDHAILYAELQIG